MVAILFAKASLSLFPEITDVAGHIRHGKFVAPYRAIRNKVSHAKAGERAPAQAMDLDLQPPKASPPGKSYSVENGALTDVPIYEPNSRGKNWCATIAIDPASPGGIARSFWKTAHGDKFYYILPSQLAKNEERTGRAKLAHPQ